MADQEQSLFVDDDEVFTDEEEMDEDEYADSQIYQEDTELLPKAPAYDKDFPLVSKTIAELVTGFQSNIPEGVRDTPRFKHLFDTTERLKNFPATPPKYRINIVGKSGAGKSSLLNSLLGRPRLAKSVAGSKGCTHVPTSYEKGFPGQTKPMAVGVEFFTAEERRTKLDLMLKDYYAWTQSDEKELVPEEVAEMKNAALTALAAFRSLFNEQDEFSTKQAAEKFLAQEYGKDHKLLVGKMVDWSQELIDEALLLDDDDESEYSGKDEDRDFKEFDDQGELTAFIEPFGFSDSKYSKPALWPLVKIIRQGLLGIRLLEFITITDWPGSDDTNRLRAKASAERIYHCDEIWILSSADRIGTDPTVTSNLIRYGNDVPCTVICTCIDEKLDEALAKEMEKEAEDIGNHNELLREERDLEKKIRSTETKVNTRQEAIQRGSIKKAGTNKRLKLDPQKRDQFRQELPELQSQLLKAQDDLQQVSQQRFDLLVSIRNYIANVLHDNVAHHLEHGQVLLFCVSNLHYDLHKSGRMGTGPRLSIGATGIPALRRYVFESAAPRILDNVKQFVNTQVSVLMHGANVVANPESFEGGQQVQDMIESKRDEVAPVIDQYLTSVKTLASTELKEPLSWEQDELVEAALKRLEEKKQWHWCSIRAFVRREGCHETPKHSKQSWNDHFMEPAALIISGTKNNGRWRTFEMDDKNRFRMLQNRLIEECHDIPTKLEADAAGFRLPKQEFHTFIKGQAHSIEATCEKFRTEFSQALTSIKLRSILANGDIPEAYFNVAMREAWERCQELYGPQWKARVMAILETHLTLKHDRSPFAVLANSMADAIALEAKDRLDVLRDQIRDNFDDTWKWLEGMFDRGAEGNYEQVAAAEKLQKYLIVANSDFEDVKALIRTLERRCKIKEEAQ